MTCCVGSDYYRGLLNKNSSIFILHSGVVINRNFTLFVVRVRKGRSGRHRNTIPRQVIILLRAPNLWSGILRYPLNHPSFHFIRSTFLRFSFSAFSFPRFYKRFELKNKISIAHRRSAFKIALVIDSSPMLCHIRVTDIDCGYDWMLTFYIDSPTKHISWLVNDTITLARGSVGSGVIISLRQIEQTNKRYPPFVIIGSRPTLKWVWKEWQDTRRKNRSVERGSFQETRVIQAFVMH